LAALVPFSVKGYGWFFVSGPAACLYVSARRQVIKIFMDNRPIPRFRLLASRPRILPPKPEVFEYLTNYIRVLDQADDPHLRAASWAGQGIDLPEKKATFFVNFQIKVT